MAKVVERWKIPSALKAKMHELASQLRKQHTASEEMLWEALRNRQLDGRKFRRQNPTGALVVDFYCPSERLVVEVDGGIHADQLQADAERQAIIESLGVRFVRFTAEQVENDLPAVQAAIRSAFENDQSAR